MKIFIDTRDPIGSYFIYILCCDKMSINILSEDQNHFIRYLHRL